jgi:cytochrome c oxidase subunit 2
MGLRSCAVKRSLFGLRHFSLYSAHCLLLISLLIHCDDVFAESVKYNMTRGVTEISGQVYNLHMIIFYICCAIAAIVFGLMFWSIIHHRKSKGAEPAQFHGSLKIEILWTAIPVVILVAMAIPASKTLIAMEDASKADITVLVTGSQWKWHYKYLEYPIEFYSLLATSRDAINNNAEKPDLYLRDVDKPLVLPSDKKIRFLVTADDVIHSWWVPAFAVKKDANPGFINETWTKVDKPGIYRGQCAELCGKDHAFMPIVVDVRTPEEFDRWVAQELARQEQEKAAEAARGIMTMDELMIQGQEIYATHCAACHQVSGEGLPGVIPALKGSVMVTSNIPDHIQIVVNGKAGTAMQAFGKQLTNSQLAAVITYERNAWGNNTGELVQATDIAAIKVGE